MSLALLAAGPVLLLGNIPRRRGTARHRVRCWSSSAVLRASSAPVLSHACCAGTRVVLVRSSLPAPLHEVVTPSAPSTDASCWSRRTCVIKRASSRSVSPVEFHDRIQVGTRLLVEPERDGRVPPAAGLQEHKLHGYFLGVVLEQGESEAQARSERGRAVLREQVRMQGSSKLVHGAYRLDGLLAVSRVDESLTLKEH